MEPDFSNNRSRKRENAHSESGDLTEKKKNSYIQKLVNKERTKIVDNTLTRLRSFAKSLPFLVEVKKASGGDLSLDTSTNRNGESQLTISVGALSDVEIQQINENKAVISSSEKTTSATLQVYLEEYPEDWTFFIENRKNYFLISWETEDKFKFETLMEREVDSLLKESRNLSFEEDRKNERKRVPKKK